MNMKKLKNSLPMLIILSLVTTAMISVSPVQANPTALSVLFANGTSSSINEDQSPFDLYVYISDVELLYTFDFTLNYNTAVLTANSITLGDFFPAESKIWTEEINDAAGSLRYIVSMPLETPRGEGMTGSGVLAIITCSVDDLGATALDLCDTKLANGDVELIPHEANDGFFCNTGVVGAALILWKLKVNHAAGIGKGHKANVGEVNTLEAYVNNTGTYDVNVKAYFLITDAAFTPVATVESGIVLVPVGISTKVSATWTASEVDVYLITAYLFYGPYPAQTDIEDGSSRTVILQVLP